MDDSFLVVAINDYQLPVAYATRETSIIRSGTSLIAVMGPVAGTYEIRWMLAWHRVNADRFSVLGE